MNKVITFRNVSIKNIATLININLKFLIRNNIYFIPVKHKQKFCYKKTQFTRKLKK